MRLNAIGLFRTGPSQIASQPEPFAKHPYKGTESPSQIPLVFPNP
jgi:hypothetical protein